MGRVVKSASLVVLLAALAVPSVAAEPDGNSAYRELGVGSSGEQVTFRRRVARPGDRIVQQVEVKLELNSTTRSGEQVVAEHKTNLARLQQQTMVADEVVDGKTVAARVRFEKSQHAMNDQPPENSPVAGQVYHCRREGEDLQVTRDDGTLATPLEHEQVSASMASLGRTNPLAEFFAGKSIKVGEKVALPTELGATLLGGDGTLGEVSRFEMTLKELVVRDGRRVAIFDTEIEAEAEDGVQMRLVLAGTIALEAETCRAERLELEGPLARMSSFGSYSRRETTSVRGKMAITMNASYTDK